jgi:Domain of unknown function (DU1801)
MKNESTTIEDYLASLPDDRKIAMNELRKNILSHIPKGFQECMSYGMIGYVIPHTIYPSGYHCDPKLPLPFMNIASQKNFIAVYHMGIYSDPKLMEWFTETHLKISSKKIDMGKSCIRYKKMEDIPFNLIGELAGKVTPQDWIYRYESLYKKK